MHDCWVPAKIIASNLHLGTTWVRRMLWEMYIDGIVDLEVRKGINPMYYWKAK